MRGEKVLTFPRLDGGLNLRELSYRMASDQSPEMKNLCWRDGALCSRDGQVWLTEENTPGTGYAAYESTVHSAAFLHIGDGIWSLGMEGRTGDTLLAPVRLCNCVPENRGTFFRWGDSLYYKNRGGYFRIQQTDGGFSCAPVEAYTPVILINADPATGAGDLYQSENRLSPKKTVWYTAKAGETEYHLPVGEVDSIDRVEVDGVETMAYTADLGKGIVTFEASPPQHDGVTANTVRITYAKYNAAAYQSIMDCPHATTYGGEQNACIVLGGGDSQPNTYFWSGSHTILDSGYFPMEQYNLAGAADEPITGFGKQQNLLVIFKENSVGRAVMSTAEMASGRVVLTMDYTPINDCIGCDLPGTIQLIENNLVFCNTRQGVHLLRDSSSAHENNILCISGNVNGTALRPGLLEKVRAERTACSFDDGGSYWIVSGGDAYQWDYAISTAAQPSWFYHTDIHAVSLFQSGSHRCHLNRAGRVTEFRRIFGDYGKPIHKKYRFATESMEGYDRLKNILSVLFTVRSDTDTVVHITYETDHETRSDPTPIRSFAWRVSPRNLAYRYLGGRRYATVARRRPGCHHVRHFTMTLENNEFGADMSVVSAQIFYRLQGRER